MTELEKKIEGAERGICWPFWLKLHQVDVKNLDTGRKHQGHLATHVNKALNYKWSGRINWSSYGMPVAQAAVEWIWKTRGLFGNQFT